MDKNEILSLSRRENAGKDPYAAKITSDGASKGAIAMAIVAAIIHITEIIVNGSRDYCIWSIMAVYLAVSWIYSGIKLRKHSYTALGIVWGVIFVISFIAGMTKLIKQG